MAFESPDYPLGELLALVKAGKIQLPDFQRDWKWDDDHIVSLLASISLGYPMGVVMMLETGGVSEDFATRPLAGARNHTTPERLILDGQQRLTSLFQSLYLGKPAQTSDSRGKHLERWYYLDMKSILRNGDREEAVKSVPADRKITDNFQKQVLADYSTIDLEAQQEVFPLDRVFRPDATNEWMVHYLQLDPATMETALSAGTSSRLRPY